MKLHYSHNNVFKLPQRSFPMPKITVSDPPHKWQLDFLRAVQDQPFFLLKAPCGSGKTFAQVLAASHEEVNRKQLFLVPQNHIGEGFCEKNIICCCDVCTAKEIKVNIPYNKRLISRQDSLKEETKTINRKNVIARLRGFITNPSKDTFCVSTHSAMSHAWKAMDDEERLKAITNLTLWVDECHRVNSGEVNYLGQICNFIFENLNFKTHVRLVTATYWRADGYNIVPPDTFLTHFKTYDLSWREYWEGTSINNLYFIYDEYQFEPLGKVIQNIKKAPKGKHLIIVPHLNSKFRNKEMVEKWLDKLNKLGNVLDLVTKKTQDQNKGKLLSAVRKKKWAEFDIVLACGIMNEGTDWPPCDYIHNTDCERSSVCAVQRIGRGMRDIPEIGKRALTVYYYLRNDHTSDEGFLHTCKDHTNALCMSMQIDDMFGEMIELPLLYNGEHTQRTQKIILRDIFREQTTEVFDYLLNNVFVSDGKWETLARIVDEVINRYFPSKEEIALVVSDDVNLSYEEVKSIVVKSLKLKATNAWLNHMGTKPKEAYDLDKLNEIWEKTVCPFIQEENRRLKVVLTSERLRMFHDALEITSWKEMYAKVQHILLGMRMSDITQGTNQEIFRWLKNQKDNFDRLDEEKQVRLRDIGISQFVSNYRCNNCFARIGFSGGNLCLKCTGKEESKKQELSSLHIAREKLYEGCWVGYNHSELPNNFTHPLFVHCFYDSNKSAFADLMAMVQCIHESLIGVVFLSYTAREYFHSYIRQLVKSAAQPLMIIGQQLEFTKETMHLRSNSLIRQVVSRERSKLPEKEILSYFFTLDLWLRTMKVSVVGEKSRGCFEHYLGPRPELAGIKLI